MLRNEKFLLNLYAIKDVAQRPDEQTFAKTLKQLQQMQNFLDTNEGLKFLYVSFEEKSVGGKDGPIKESNISREEDLEENKSITNNSPIKEQIKDYNQSRAA